MKKNLILCAILLVLISCSKNNTDNGEITKTTVAKLNLDSIAKMNNGAFLESVLTTREIDSINEIKASLSSKQITTTINGQQYTDGSGKIHLQFFYNSTTTAVHWPHIEAIVPSDFIVVGGGAYTFDWINQGGAYLYESRPDEGLTKWMASSKDHINSDVHNITAYAIGMKIDGVDPAYLRSKIHYHPVTSNQPANHPHASYTIPQNCLLLGGGAYDYWQTWGNMLVASYPQSYDTWYAEGKDQKYAEATNITVYAIYIENISFPNVGYLHVSSANSSSFSVESNARSTQVVTPNTWALTCPGGFESYYSWGRLMTFLYPSSSTSVELGSKDIWGYPDYGTHSTWAIMVSGN